MERLRKNTTIIPQEDVGETPKVYCPTLKERVPIWYCTGSFTQKRKMCSKLKELNYNSLDNTSTVKCKS